MSDRLQVRQAQLDAAFKEMERARQYLKERSKVRFRDPFGSPERDTAQYLYDEAERDYKAKAVAFAIARKQFDDTRMYLRYTQTKATAFVCPCSSNLELSTGHSQRETRAVLPSTVQAISARALCRLVRPRLGLQLIGQAASSPRRSRERSMAVNQQEDPKMGTYKKVGMSSEPYEPLEHPPLVPFVAAPGNFQEAGIATEKLVLANVEARAATGPAGVTFTTPQPKTYAHMQADANPAPQRSDEARAAGKPHIQKFGEE